MKTLIYISLLFFTIHCFGQTETKEDFLNGIDTTFLPANAKYYYVYGEASRIKYNNQWLQTKVRSITNDSSGNQIVYNATVDTTNLQWDISKLRIAKDIDAMPVALRAILNRTATAKQRKKYFEKAAKKNYWNKPFNEQAIYLISRPIYDNKKQFAILSIYTNYEGGWESLTPNESIYVFKNKNGHWQKYSEIKWSIGENVY